MTKKEWHEALERIGRKIHEAEERRFNAEHRGDYESQLAWAGWRDGAEWAHGVFYRKYKEQFPK